MVTNPELVNVVLDFNVPGINIVAWLRYDHEHPDGQITREQTSVTFPAAALAARIGAVRWAALEDVLRGEIAARCKVANIPIVVPEEPDVEA